MKTEMKYKVGDEIQWRWNSGGTIFSGIINEVLDFGYYKVTPLHGSVSFEVHEDRVTGLVDRSWPRKVFCDYDRAMKGL